VLDRRGVVVSRSFEERYQERATASSWPRARGRASGRFTHRRHAAPESEDDRERFHRCAGTRFSLRGHHAKAQDAPVCARRERGHPGRTEAEADDAFKVLSAEFPKGEKFYFAPLKLTQLVYSKPFRITQDVTLALTPAFRERARTAGATLEITARCAIRRATTRSATRRKICR
jgi:hypothetical protein